MIHADPNNWSEILSFIPFGIRIAFKDDIQFSAALIVSGSPFGFLIQFLISLEPFKLTSLVSLVKRLHSHGILVA